MYEEDVTDSDHLNVYRIQRINVHPIYVKIVRFRHGIKYILVHLQTHALILYSNTMCMGCIYIRKLLRAPLCNSPIHCR